MATCLELIVELLNDETKRETTPARMVFAALKIRQDGSGLKRSNSEDTSAMRFLADNLRIEFNHLLGYNTRMEVLPNGEMRYSNNPVVDALIHALEDKSIDKVKRCPCGCNRYFVQIRSDKGFYDSSCRNRRKHVGVVREIHNLRALLNYYKNRANNLTREEKMAKVNELRARIDELQAAHTTTMPRKRA